MRDIRNKVRLQARQRHFFADDVFGQHQSTDYQEREDAEDEKTLMHPGSADRLYAGILELDAQRQSPENIFKLARGFRLSVAPTGRSGQRLDLVSHLHLRRIDHYGYPISTLITQFLGG